MFLDDELSGYINLVELSTPGDRLHEPRVLSGRGSADRVDTILSFWPSNTGVDGCKARDFWKQTIDRSHRLEGTTDGRNLIVAIKNTMQTSKGYYIEFSPDGKMPVAWHQSNSATTLQSPHSRRLLTWRNLQRIAMALCLMHDRNLLHGEISDWHIYTDNTGSADHQLAGLEFSIDLQCMVNGETPLIEHQLQGSLSFRNDWVWFGRAAARLLGATDTSDDESTLLSRLAQSDVSQLEQKLIQELVLFADYPGLSGDAVISSINRITEQLARRTASARAPHRMVLDFDDRSRFSQSLRATGQFDIGIAADDIRDFIKEDLSKDPLLIQLYVPKHARSEQMAVRGQEFIYVLEPHHDSAEWSVAWCSAVYALSNHPPLNTVQSNPLKYPIEVHAAAEGRGAYSRRFYTNWTEPFKRTATELSSEDGDTGFWPGTALLFQLQALVTIAEIWPVDKIREKRIDAARNRIWLKPRATESAAELSRLLLLKPPADVMHDVLEKHGGREGTWLLSRRNHLDIPNDERGDWSFVKYHPHTQSYEFEGMTNAPVGRTLFLRPNDEGTLKQLRRQARALNVLRSHRELLDLLDSPSARSFSSHDELPEEMGGLDDSKQIALKNILSVLPISVVQGPPGVGKTKLVSALAAHLYTERNSTRILVTAQNHESLDHIASEIFKTIREIDESLLLVRANSDDSHLAFVLNSVSSSIRDKFFNSDLFASMTETFQKDTRVELDSRSNSPSRSRGRHNRALDALCLSSASIVFATANSREIGDLLSTSSQFDWVVVEEASKATALDLIGSLQLSSRRLLIGDHMQLPAFDEQNTEKRLSESSRVLDALKLGRSSLPEYVSKPLGDLNSLNMPVLCQDALRAFSIFRSLIEALANDTTRLPCHSKLTVQHRMHPTIGQLIADCFYDDLSNSPELKSRYSSPPPYSFQPTSALSTVPITVVNMPWVQTTPGMYRKNKDYINDDEVQVVKRVLKDLRVRNAKTSIAVLSPYAKQVECIKAAVGSLDLRRNRHLRKFSSLTYSTVDGFQGREADIVIVSLVRNNEFTGYPALGFLVDARRVNVMLSRARWKLVVVASLTFFERQIEWMTDNNLPHFEKIVTWIRNRARTKKDVQILRPSNTSLVNDA